MASEKTLKTKKLLGVIIPVIVLVITITVVGISYAWFSDSVEARIEPISLATTDVFTLEFAISEETGKTYFGQTVFDDDSLMITPSRGANIIDADARHKYLQDYAYMYRTEALLLTTDEKSVDFEINFSKVLIYQPEEIDEDTLEVISEEYTIKDFKNTDGSSADIPYGFTWFMTATKDSTTIVYTPYGKADGSPETDFVVSELDVAGAVKPFQLTKTTDWATTPVKRPITGFIADKDTVYQLYIVFAPEQLYWMQFSAPDKSKTAATIYSQMLPNGYTVFEDKVTINDYRDMIYYATPEYVGASFEFAVTFSVLNVYPKP